MSTDKELKAALDGATDALNALWVKANEKLRALDLGVNAGVPLPDGELCYGRIPSGWCIYVKDDRGNTPIVNCSRERRVIASKALADLVSQLRELAQVEITVVRDAQDNLRRSLEKL